jgi:hypothetical protein
MSKEVVLEQGRERAEASEASGWENTRPTTGYIHYFIGWRVTLSKKAVREDKNEDLELAPSA